MTLEEMMNLDERVKAAKEAEAAYGMQSRKAEIGDLVGGISEQLANVPTAYEMRTGNFRPGLNLKQFAIKAAPPAERYSDVLAEYRKAKMGEYADDRDFERKSALENQRIARQQDWDMKKIAAMKDQKPSKAQEAVDTSFGKDYNEFIVQGGYADAAKGISQLDNAKQKLSANPDLVGPIKGSLPKFLKDVIEPDLTAVQEAVEEVVQRNLRSVLGAQFTEKEGDRLIQRAFNPKLSAEENIRRLEALKTQMQKAVDAKMQAAKHYEKYGTMTNYQGRTDFKAIMDEFDPGQESMAATPAPKSGGGLIKEAEAGGRPAGKDAAALEWAKKNPNDPRAKQIIERLGGSSPTR
jgi:hypothetical protein